MALNSPSDGMKCIRPHLEPLHLELVRQLPGGKLDPRLALGLVPRHLGLPQKLLERRGRGLGVY